MNDSKIEWTDKTWNPVTGCTKVSRGCKHCYAETFYERFHGKGSFKHVTCHQDRLSIPLKWKKPSLVFVNSMSDLFHEDVPFEFINAVFSVMADVRQHTYQVLTKRAKRMYEFWEWKSMQFGIPWQPSSNVWIGVSVENQEQALERIPYLVKVDCSVRFLSCEPLLGSLDITNGGLKNAYSVPTRYYPDLRTGKNTGIEWTDPGDAFIGVNWVIAGGESGNKAEPLYPDWVRNLRDQCATVSVPFFFKQWGAWALYDWPNNQGHPIGIWKGGIFKKGNYVDSVGSVFMTKTGKKKAGRLLDNVEYNEMPIR